HAGEGRPGIRVADERSDGGAVTSEDRDDAQQRLALAAGERINQDDERAKHAQQDFGQQAQDLDAIWHCWWVAGRRRARGAGGTREQEVWHSAPAARWARGSAPCWR